MVVFQHNSHVEVTKESYEYVREYKKQLVQNITNLFNDLKIRFVISHGNLIEYERGRPIYHDDDVDVRFCERDLHKWIKYIDGLGDMTDDKYNMRFRTPVLSVMPKDLSKKEFCDFRYGHPITTHVCDKIERLISRFAFSADTYHWKQAHLLNYKNHDVSWMDLQIDIVVSCVKSSDFITQLRTLKPIKFWNDYNINFNNLRKITYIDVETYAPNKKDTKNVLTYRYGCNYMTPDYKEFKI